MVSKKTKRNFILGVWQVSEYACDEFPSFSRDSYTACSKHVFDRILENLGSKFESKIITMFEWLSDYQINFCLTFFANLCQSFETL